MDHTYVEEFPGSRPQGSRTHPPRSGKLSFLALLVVLSFLAPTAADADLWGQLTYGRDIVRQAWVHTSDPYSFTSDRPWVNHEWLSVAIFWAAYAAGGAAGLVTLKLLLACAIAALLLAAWQRHNLPPIWRDALLFTTALGVWPLFSTIRPQVFSLALMAALLVILERLRDGYRKPLLLLPPLFVVWVNLHGGWIVGAGVLALFVFCSFFDTEITRRSRYLLIGAAIASAIGTLVNPYGLLMLTFLFDTVRPERSDVVEWQSVTQLPAVALVLWCVPTVVALAGLWRGRRNIHIFKILVVVVLGVGAFLVARLGGFYALAVGMCLAPYLKSPDGIRVVVRQRRPIWYSATVCVLMISLAVALFGRRITMPAIWLPEPDAAEFIKAHALTGRMLTWFNYGQYAIWHFSPEIQVSMDGRREAIYSEGIRALHWRIYRNEPSALNDVNSLNPDYIWLPTEFPVVARLQTAGWRPLFMGSRSTLLGRTPVDPIAGMKAQSSRGRSSDPSCAAGRFFPCP